MFAYHEFTEKNSETSKYRKSQNDISSRMIKKIFLGIYRYWSYS